MQRTVPKLLVGAVFTALLSQAAAADATSTIRALMAERGVSRTTLARLGTDRPAPVLTERAPGANAMLRSLLTHQGLAHRGALNSRRAMPRAEHPAPHRQLFTFSAPVPGSGCRAHSGNVTTLRFRSASNVAVIHVSPCVTLHHHGELRLGTGLSPARPMAFSYRMSGRGFGLPHWPLPIYSLAR